MANMTTEFANIRRRLTSLPNIIQNRVVKGATRAAAKAVQIEARKRVPIKSGGLKKSIKIKKYRKKNTEVGHVKYRVVATKKVEVRKGIGVYRNLGAILEYGNSDIPATPFMRPAFQASRIEPIRAFHQYAFSRVEKEIAKLANV